MQLLFFIIGIVFAISIYPLLQGIIDIFYCYIEFIKSNINIKISKNNIEINNLNQNNNLSNLNAIGFNVDQKYEEYDEDLESNRKVGF